MLRTIDDLRVDTLAVKDLIARAMNLSRWYDAWKEVDAGGYSYTVDVAGSHQRAPGIHASEISNCPRKAVYTMLGTEQRKEGQDVSMQRRFNVGHAVHAMLQNEMKLMSEWMSTPELSLTFEDEVAIGPDLQQTANQWNIHSACDGLFTFKYMGAPYLRVGLEIKTKSDKEYTKLKAPEPMHLEQTCVYMKALDIPLMWLLYYNKSNSSYTNSEAPFLFKFDEGLWEKKLVPRFKSFHAAAEANNIPAAVEGFYCRWCPYRWTCNPKSLQTNQQFGAAANYFKPSSLRLPGW